MQLRLLAVALVLTVCGANALADGEVALRAAYYKEDATRVSQPMFDARFSVGENGQANGHFLVDAISSASIAAGANGASFSETRVEAGAGYSHKIGPVEIAGAGRYSKEPDYRSIFVSARGKVELAEKNTLIELALARGQDDITNGSQQGIADPIEGELDTSLGSLSITQLLSPSIFSSLTYDLIHASGFLENAYRSVAAGGTLQRERVPDSRLRHALLTSTRAFIEKTNSIALLNYRFYIDDWGVVGHTPELRVIQTLKENVFAHLRYRFHIQSQANFFEETYDTADPLIEPFLTNDPKLSSFTTHTMGGKLEIELGALGLTGKMARIRTEATLEYIIQRNRFGNGINAQFAVTVPFEY